MNILNLTTTPATIEQIEAGVSDLATDQQRRLAALLTLPLERFWALTDDHQTLILRDRAKRIVKEVVAPLAIADISRSLNNEHGVAVGESVDLTSIGGCGRLTCMVGSGIGFAPLTNELVRQLKKHGHVPLYGMPSNSGARYIPGIYGGLLPA